MILELHSRSSRYDGRRRGGGAFDDGGSYYAGSRGPVYNDSNYVFVDPHVLGKILVLHGLACTSFFSVVIQDVHYTTSFSDYLSATFLIALLFLLLFNSFSFCLLLIPLLLHLSHQLYYFLLLPLFEH